MIRFDLDEFICSDLLSREKSLFSEDLIFFKKSLVETLKDARILVIGGAGTIGGSFIKAALAYGPKEVVVVDLNENGLTELVRDVRSDAKFDVPESFITYPLDFGSDIFLRWYKEQASFDVVANFAALKHVRSEKDILSIEAMLHNNVIKNYKFLQSMRLNQPGRFFCVSTDKAANPVNVMGASKKLMEVLLMAYSKELHISTARFANVAFSNGSLPYGFLRRLERNQPLSAPKNIKRYFISPEESGQLCMLACAVGKSGDIYFPKVNVKSLELTFTEIAERLLTQLGYEIDYCTSEDDAREKAHHRNSESKTYPVYFFDSDTSGEKSLEEFYTEDELVDKDFTATMGVVNYKDIPCLNDVITLLADLTDLIESKSVSKPELISKLEEIIPEFKHIETGRNLDQSM